MIVCEVNEPLAITDAQEEYLINWLDQRGLTLKQFQYGDRPSFSDVLALATQVGKMDPLGKLQCIVKRDRPK